MARIIAIWNRLGVTRAGADLAMVALLGAVAYALFRHAADLRPMEGAALIMTCAGLLLIGRRWWRWQQRLGRDGFLEDWTRRILSGEREVGSPQPGLDEVDQKLFAALSALVEEADRNKREAGLLREAAGREWRALDALLADLQAKHEGDTALRTRAGERIRTLGRDLKLALEKAFSLEELEMNQRLRSDQHRMQGQAFRAALGQNLAGVEQLEELLHELRDSFPRLRREEDALGRLADAGLRQGARLSLAVKGLVAHTPRLVEEAQARQEWLRRFRLSADAVRDQSEALARRIEAFREETQRRTRSFGAARSTMKGLDLVAQQTGLLAVNASILAQQEAGSAGMAAIGGRLRSLADQTADGASELERALDRHQEGLERETTGVWDLQEATERLLAGMNELLRMSSFLDQQSHDLERALDTHLGMVDQVRQASERAEISLHEAGERALGLDAALVRQWAVEAKLAPEMQRLVRVGTRLGEVGEELSRVSQAGIDGVWDLLQRHQDVRRSEGFRQFAAEDFSSLLPPPEDPDPDWNRVARARAERRPRLAVATRDLRPMLETDELGQGWLHLLGQDALGLPEPSALEAWPCDPTGRIWHLHLLESVRTEQNRLALLEAIRQSILPACFPGLDARISSEGVDLSLPTPYLGFPGFLSGLGLRLPAEPSDWAGGARPWVPTPSRVQRLMWFGPADGGGRRHSVMRLVHSWVKDDGQHEAFLPALPYAGHRPPCPMLEEHDEDLVLEGPLPVQCLGLGVEPVQMHPLRDRLIRAGAIPGSGGAVLGAVGIGHPHPDALLIRLFQPDLPLAGTFHPELVPYQIRLRDDVLAAGSPDSYRAAWALLEDLQREGWLMPLPTQG